MLKWCKLLNFYEYDLQLVYDLLQFILQLWIMAIYFKGTW